MNDPSRTHQDLIDENTLLKQRVRELEQSDAERRSAEEALKASEERYRQLVREAPAAIYEIDFTARKFLSVNDVMCQYLGYTREELLAIDPIDIITPETLNIFLERRMRLMAGESISPNSELQIRRKDGSLIWALININSSYARTVDGHVVVTVVAHDITDRKQAEEALKASEEKYRDLVKYAPAGIYEIDFTTLSILSVNDAMCEYSGYTREEILAGDPRQILSEESLNRFLERHVRIMAGEPVPESVEFELRRKDGSLIWCLLNNSYSRTPEGHVVSTVIIHDITERKRAEEALKRSEEQYRYLVKHAPAGIYEVDFTAGRFLSVNDAMCLYTGYSREELLEMEPINIVEEGNRATMVERILRILAGKPVDNDVEVRIRRKDGGLTWAYLNNSFSRRADGHLVSTVIAHNITERKRAEEEKKALMERLQRAEKMEALGTMAGGVAHDLNNVLGIVVGYAEMLLTDMKRSDPLRDGLTDILEHGKRAAAIVQDLLTLARRGVSTREVLNLNNMIAEYRTSPALAKLSTRHSAIRIVTDLEPDLLNVSGSAVHLSTSLYNLIANACESMPDGGTVVIRTRNQYLDKPIQGYDEVREGDYCVLSVSDTGQGISEADLPCIFEPFYTKKVMGRSGTGLGLAVVWGTMKDHDGYINVESRVNVGSTFTLYFPVTQEALASERAPVSVDEYMGRGETVLVVDDIAGQRSLATVMLERLNYSVASVASGEEAVAYVREHPVDILVLDMIMEPGMDGLDTYRSITQFRPGQKAVIVSGYSETERVRAAQALGAGAYVKKPYILEKLGQAVRKEMDRA
ncbi:MAG: Blue-light-activated protein [Syntrophaceae bacterium PtaU1.Bin231]|nr:MAG: Blue-light-activated protein [Syntrophaceae bacterium PtaU1.Bin231]